MRKLEILLIAAGLGMLAVIVKQLDFHAVKSALSLVGAGFILILAQEITAHVLNTLGWKYAFLPELSSEIPFSRLLKMRIAGDGLNYLTPSATMAGEWAKAHMLGERHPMAVRLSSVALAKITQTTAMALISAAGLTWAFLGKVSLAGLSGQLKAGVWLLAGLFAAVIFLEIRAAGSRFSEDSPRPVKQSKWGQIKALDKNVTGFIREHPARFFLSTACFILAYLWGAFEAWWIARFLGSPVTAASAVLIELLSVFMDGIFFAVPGKAGTQETTKTAIFAAMGMSPSLGFAFAVVRHIREISWALAGLALFYHDRKTRLGSQ